MPMPFTGRGVHGVAWAHDDDLAAARLDQPDPVGDVQCLPAGVGVPGGAGAGGEAHGVHADPRRFLALGDDVEVHVAGEHLGRSLGGGTLR